MSTNHSSGVVSAPPNAKKRTGRTIRKRRAAGATAATRRRSRPSASSGHYAQPSAAISSLPKRRKGRVGGSHEVGIPAALKQGRFVAWGTKLEDVKAVEEMNAAADEYNAQNARQWYNSYDHIPDSDALPVQDGATMDWSADGLGIADHWFMPTRLDDLVDNYYHVQAIDRWVEQWTRTPLVLPRRCVLLCRGPPGVGKTTAIRLILHKHGFNNVVEINASDVRSKRLINQRLVPLLLNSSVNGARRTAIVLEEVDGLHAGSGGGSSTSASVSSTAPSASAAAAAAAVSASGGTSTSATNGAGGSFSGGTHAHGVSNGNNGGADTLVRFLSRRGYRPRGAVGGLSAPCKTCVRGPCDQCKRATIRRRSSCATCSRRAKACATCKSTALKRQAACRQCATMSCRRCKDRPQPEPVLRHPYTESWQDFRSTVPIIMLANNDYQPFMKALENVSVFVPFFPIKKECMQRRIRDDLSRRFNIYWSQPRSHNGVPLWERLVNHTDGDMRKAIMLMTAAVRAAYARKRALPVDDPERDLSRLLIKRVDCEAFLGRSRADVHDKSWSLWQGLNFLMRQCKTIEQAQRVAAQEMRSVPDWIFENYPQCAALPRNPKTPLHEAAATANLRLLSRAFSDAETVRSDFVYLCDRLAQRLYTHLGLVMPVMLTRRPNQFGVPDCERNWNPTPSTAMLQLPPQLTSSNGRRALKFQKSSLDGENGNAGLTLSRAIKERNCYADRYGLLQQADVSQFYDFDNYVSNMSQTRTQRKMTFKEADASRLDGRRAAPDIKRTKMSAAQQAAARQRQRIATELADTNESPPSRTATPSATKRRKTAARLSPSSASSPSPAVERSDASASSTTDRRRPSTHQTRLDTWMRGPRNVGATATSTATQCARSSALTPVASAVAASIDGAPVSRDGVPRRMTALVKRSTPVIVRRVRRERVIESDSEDEEAGAAVTPPTRLPTARVRKRVCNVVGGDDDDDDDDDDS